MNSLRTSKATALLSSRPGTGLAEFLRIQLRAYLPWWCWPCRRALP